MIIKVNLIGNGASMTKLCSFEAVIIVIFLMIPEFIFNLLEVTIISTNYKKLVFQRRCILMLQDHFLVGGNVFKQIKHGSITVFSWSYAQHL